MSVFNMFRLLKKINQILPVDMGNIYYNINNLFKHGTMDFFNCVDIETATACNRRCSYCPNSKFENRLPKNNKTMDDKLFRRIIDMLADINFTGRVEPSFYNEPLMDKRLPEMIKYIHNKIPSAKITIYTNGDFLTIELFNKLVNNGVYEFIISQHGNSHSRNMKLLLNYLKDKPEKKAKILSYNNPTSDENKILYNRGGLIDIPGRVRLKWKRCILPSNLMVINYKGDVILCCNDYSSSVVFGNLKKESILQVWNKPEYRRIRKQLKKGKFDLDICKRCRVLVRENNNTKSGLVPI